MTKRESESVQLEQGNNTERYQQSAYDRIKRAGALLGVVAVSAVALAAGNLSPSAKGEAGSLRVEKSPLVASVNGVIEIDNQPFFPIMNWRQKPEDVSDNLDIVNTFVGTYEDKQVQELVDEIDGRAYVIPPYDNSNSKKEYFGEIGRQLPDEPDGWGILPSELPQTKRIEETGRLIYQNLTVHYNQPDQAPIITPAGHTINAEDYLNYIKNADFIGTDIYPKAWMCNVPTLNKISVVYDYQRALSNLANGKPTSQWMEVNEIEGKCGDNPLTPDEMRAEAYLAIAGGADGLGFFTYRWKEGVEDRFYATPEMLQALKKLSDEIGTLTPILLAPELPFTSGPKDPIKIGGRIYKGEYYMIAVNSSENLVDWRRKPNGALLRNQKITINGADKEISARNGWINDKFDPLQVKIYHWVPQNKGGKSQLRAL